MGSDEPTQRFTFSDRGVRSQDRRDHGPGLKHRFDLRRITTAEMKPIERDDPADAG